MSNPPSKREKMTLKEREKIKRKYKDAVKRLNLLISLGMARIEVKKKRMEIHELKKQLNYLSK